MENIFLVLGYGVPKKIEADVNYNTYLRLVFNSIYSAVNGNKNPLIIFCGGYTDIFPPFKRDEASQMLQVFRTMANRSFVKKATLDWRYQLENKSLSTLENLYFSRQILKKKKIAKANMTIFCEATRIRKVSVMAKKVFDRNFEIRVVALDFDFSPTRYLANRLIVGKEKQDLQFALWSMANPANMKKHHQAFLERLDFFRKQGPLKHQESIRIWWEHEIKELKVK